jgi:hypothetical protein
MAKQVAPERHEICEVVATLLAHAGGMNERTDSRRLFQLNYRYWRESDHRHAAGGRQLELDLLGDI